MKNKKRLLIYIVIILLSVGFIFIPRINTKQETSKPAETIVIDDPRQGIPGESSDSEKEEVKPWEIYYKNETNLDSVREKYGNNEIIAELYIPDLIDVYLARANDNEYYLNHNLYRKKDIKGSEYMDYRVGIDSKQINLYGHNSSTFNIPFRKLEKFLDQDFFESHPYVIMTFDGEERAYEILSIKEISTDYEHMKVNPQSMVEHIDKMIDGAIFVRKLDYDENTRLLVMQTCSYAHKDNYYIITAIEIDKK